MIFTKYRELDGQITGVLAVTSEEDARLSCLPGESFVEGRGDQITQEVYEGKIVRKSEQVIEDYEIEQAWQDLRTKRQFLLSGSDWTQVPDAPVDHAAWAVYRQELRDLPQNTSDPRYVVWPIKP
jgi:hypothetical protein